MILKDQHFVHVVGEESWYYFVRQENWSGHSQYFLMRCLRGGIPGLRSQKDGVLLGVDILRAAPLERSVQVEASLEVFWILWMAWWGSDGLNLVGELRVCVLLRLVSKSGVLMVWCMSFLQGR